MMFRTTATATAMPPQDVPPEQLIPLSVLALDLDAPSVGGWDAYLAGRGVAVLVDDVGRPSIGRSDARLLITERRKSEVRKREAMERQEQRAIEADRLWRSQLSRGVPWYAVPDGVLPVVAMTQAARDAQPRRTSVLQEALANSGELTFHALPSSPDES